MPQPPAMRRDRRRTDRSPFAFAVLAFAALVAAGCGVSIGSTDRESEIFAGLSVEGDFVPGGRLSLTLSYEQPYSVDVAVSCRFLDGAGDAGPEVVDLTLDANPEGGVAGEVTPVVGTAAEEVTAPDRPGRYILECFTPEAEENFIRRAIEIVQPAPPAP